MECSIELGIVEPKSKRPSTDIADTNKLIPSTSSDSEDSLEPPFEIHGIQAAIPNNEIRLEQFPKQMPLIHSMLETKTPVTIVDFQDSESDEQALFPNKRHLYSHKYNQLVFS